VIRLFKERKLSDPLGRLEAAVMDVVWDRGECSVREVAARLARPLAYTTVMTTLDRLYKKGLLARRRQERAFLYAPRFSRREWEQKRAGEVFAGLLAGRSTDVLISCLVDAAGNAALLDELERKIRDKRKQLEREARK
jgi:predicted transcriptional regulator